MLALTPNRAGLGEADRERLLYRWNATGAAVPDLCVHELFERQAAASPEAVAVVHEDRRLSYRELDRRANQVAHHLRRLGVGPETLVGVCMERVPELVVALLAVWKAGGAYVPLDPAYPPERLAFMVGDAGARVLLTQEKLRALFPAAGDGLVCLDTDWPAIARESAERPAAGALPSNLAYVIYTSGSTGQPKGAMILHSGLVNYLTWAIEAYGVAAGGSVPVHSSISFDLTVTSLYPALLAGGQVELLPEDAGAQNLIAALRRAKNRTLVKITPAHLELLGRTFAADEVVCMTRLLRHRRREPARREPHAVAELRPGDAAHQRVRPDRDGGRLLRPRGRAGRPAGRLDPDRAADRQHAALCARRPISSRCRPARSASSTSAAPASRAATSTGPS